MSKYNTFLFIFLASVIATIVFLIFYMQSIFGLAFHGFEVNDDNPFEFFSRIFSPQVIISGTIMVIASLAYRILGIVYVARNKAASGGEMALWIIGFLLMGFVTGIVFLVLAKGRKFA